MPLQEPNIVVVGAGIGGLACAVDLAASGHRVSVLERMPCAGGKARTVQIDGRELDAGPTVLTMPWVFDELFGLAGASFRGALELRRADVLARHAWSDGQRLDLFADKRASTDAIGRAFGAAEARAYEAFCEDGRKLYELSLDPFLRSPKPTMGGIWKQFGASGLAAFARMDGHRSMARALEQRFTSPRLRQLFGRYATYCGSSPYEAPATLNLVAHVESDGVFRARGGTRGLIVAMERLARQLGVEIRYDSSVDRVLVEGGRARGVIVQGAHVAANAVVFNGDVSGLGALLDRPATVPATPREARSLSAVTWTMVGRTKGFPLLHHNVFFSDDYAAEFEALLERRVVPSPPTVYVCAQDREDLEIDADDERLLVLANAPATGDEPGLWSEAERERCTKATMRQIERLGLTIEPRASVQTTPVEFHQLFPGTGGSLYGPRSTGALSALSREGSTTKVRGLYLAGGSVHPGSGLPMAALSGRRAAEQVRADLGSTGMSARVATSGTTSTG